MTFSKNLLKALLEYAESMTMIGCSWGYYVKNPAREGLTNVICVCYDLTMPRVYRISTRQKIYNFAMQKA